MNRRVLTAILVVAGLAIAGFGVPLAIAVQQLYNNEAIVRLGREVARAGAEVPASFRTSGDPVELLASDSDTRLGLYAPDGRRLQGYGPDPGGEEVTRAATGRVVENTDGAFVVAAPLSSEEEIFAVVRAELPGSAVNDRVRRARLLMGALGGVVVGAAALIGLVLSRRIAKSVADLAAASARLGNGDFTVRASRSGIAELDIAADNLDATAARLGRLVERERAFSADASHQLRTPLTGLRLHLETALANPSLDASTAMTVALGEVDRLERTIDELLTLARDTHSSGGDVNVREVFDDLERAWHGRLAATGRPLRVEIGADSETAHASPTAVRQILDALIANAVAHGRGTVQLRAHGVAGGVAIDVSDHGPGVPESNAIFERRSGSEPGHGIGLALARSLAEAEDARLFLVNAGPGPTFRLVLRSE